MIGIQSSQQNIISLISAFNPGSLFAGGENGSWYDPSDLGTLWQDSSGTIPVTSDGDPVGRVDDKSGNGNHLTQTTSSRRPTYKTNGTLHWLEFDGTDDYLRTNDGAMNEGSLSVCCGFLSSVTIKSIWIWPHDSSSHVSPYARFNLFHGVSDALESRINSVSYVSAAGAADKTNGNIFYIDNGVSPARLDGQSAITFTPATISYPEPVPLLLCANIAQGECMNGRIYSFVAVNRSLTATERNNLESHTASKSNVII